MNTICVYCGSADKLHPDYLASAAALGAALAQRKIRIVYGAGSTGLMGALADGALQAGGEVIGVIPAMFNTPQLAHTRLSHLEVVDSMHTRKARLIEMADGFIALPGGFGTFEELFEVLTWAQIGLHRKPVGLLNTRGYFTPLLKMISQAYSEGFIYNEHRKLFSVAEEPEKLIDALLNHQHPSGLERWLERDQ